MDAAELLIRRAMACTEVAWRCFEPRTVHPRLLEALATLWTNAAAAKKASDASLRFAPKIAALRQHGRALEGEMERTASSLRASGNHERADELEGDLARYRGALHEDLRRGEERCEEEARAIVDLVEPFEAAVRVVAWCLEGTPEHAELLRRLAPGEPRSGR